MQEEIFGPILPGRHRRRTDDGHRLCATLRPRPLALDSWHPSRVAAPRAGADDVRRGAREPHPPAYAQDDLPFGGIGPSGMGAYHGIEGFRTMSHAKSVFKQARVNLVDLFRPPFGKVFDVLLNVTLR